MEKGNRYSNYHINSNMRYLQNCIGTITKVKKDGDFYVRGIKAVTKKEVSILISKNDTVYGTVIV